MVDFFDDLGARLQRSFSIIERDSSKERIVALLRAQKSLISWTASAVERGRQRVGSPGKEMN